MQRLGLDLAHVWRRAHKPLVYRMNSAPNLKPRDNTHAVQFNDTASKPALLTAAQSAREVYNVSERLFHLLRKRGLVPPPVVLGKRMLRWHRQELEAAIAALPRQTEPAPEPAQLRKRGRDGKGGA